MTRVERVDCRRGFVFALALAHCACSTTVRVRRYDSWDCTGSPYHAAAIDGRTGVVVARPPSADGRHRTEILRFDAAGHVVSRRQSSHEGEPLHVEPGGSLFLAGRQLMRVSPGDGIVWSHPFGMPAPAWMGTVGPSGAVAVALRPSACAESGRNPSAGRLCDGAFGETSSVALFDPRGTLRYVRPIEGGRAPAPALDAAENVWVTSGMLVRLDPAGRVRAQWPIPSGKVAFAVAPSGDLVVAGTFAGPVQLPGFERKTPEGSAAHVYVARLRRDGAPVFLRTWNAAALVREVTATADGAAIVTGTLGDEPVDFGTGAIGPGYGDTEHQHGTGFVLVLDENGDTVLARSAGQWTTARAAPSSRMGSVLLLRTLSDGFARTCRTDVERWEW